jgi:hypothetical protein
VTPNNHTRRDFLSKSAKLVAGAAAAALCVPERVAGRHRAAAPARGEWVLKCRSEVRWNGEQLYFTGAETCQFEYTGPVWERPPVDPAPTCDAAPTGDAEVDLLARYIYAEAGDEGDEMNAIGQAFLNRLHANFGGATTLSAILKNGSIADNGKGSPKFRATNTAGNIGRLDAGSCVYFKSAQDAARYVLRTNPNANQPGGGILPGNDYMWFLGGQPRTPGVRVGQSVFYNFDPQNPNRRGENIIYWDTDYVTSDNQVMWY